MVVKASVLREYSTRENMRGKATAARTPTTMMTMISSRRVKLLRLENLKIGTRLSRISPVILYNPPTLLILIIILQSAIIKCDNSMPVEVLGRSALNRLDRVL